MAVLALLESDMDSLTRSKKTCISIYVVRRYLEIGFSPSIVNRWEDGEIALGCKSSTSLPLTIIEPPGLLYTAISSDQYASSGGTASGVCSVAWFRPWIAEDFEPSRSGISLASRKVRSRSESRYLGSRKFAYLVLQSDWLIVLYAIPLSFSASHLIA